MQKRLVPTSIGASLAKRHHLEDRIEGHPGGRKSTGGSVLPVQLMLGRRGAMGVGTPDVSQSKASSSSSLILQAGMPSHFLDQWRSITSNRFVLNMVQGHHIQLRSCPTLFHNF